MSVPAEFFLNLLASSDSEAAVAEAISDNLDIPLSQLRINEVGPILEARDYGDLDPEMVIEFVEYEVEPTE